MLVAFSRIVRKGRQGVSHPISGAALQSAVECISVDLVNHSSCEEDDRITQAAGSEAASTSSALFSSAKRSVPSSHSVLCFGLLARHASTAADSHTARRREILRDAAQKVSAGSTWLLAYSHNIDPRQLTYRLGKRSTLHGLREGWALYQQKFDTVAMAALLRRVRVAQLYDPDFNAAAAQELLTALEPRLRSITMRFGKLRDTIAYLHALAKLRSPPPTAAPGVAGLPNSISSGSSGGNTGAAAGVAPGTAVPGATDLPEGTLLLCQPSDLVLDLAAWATRDRTQMLNASPRRLATLLWALLRTLPPELYGHDKLQVVLDRVALCSIRRWSTFAPQDLRVYAVAYATFGIRGAAAFKGTAPDGSWRQGNHSWLGTVSSWPEASLKPSVSSGSGGSAAARNGADAAPMDVEGRRLKRNALVLQVVADTLAQRVGDLTVSQPEPRDLTLAAHALALQGVPEPHLPLLVRAAGAAAAAPHSLQPLELVLLVEVLAAYGVRQPVLLDVVREQARGWTGTMASSSAEEGLTAAAAGSAAAKQPQHLQLRLAKAYERLGAKL